MDWEKVVAKMREEALQTAKRETPNAVVVATILLGIANALSAGIRQPGLRG